jgi:hypothetical protein
MSVIILDIDNCIADDKWRIPRINWQVEDPLNRYHDYHSLSAFDNAHNHDLYINTLCDIVIFTARPIMYRALTEEWLRRHGVGYQMLMMRDMEDHSPSTELKRKQLMALFNNTDIKAGDIVGAFDDRPDVVQMYKEFGIPAAVRSVHEVCAYTPPLEQKLKRMGYELEQLEKDNPFNQFMESVNADSRQSDGADAGDLQGARQSLQGELFDDRGNPVRDVSGRHNPQDRRRPQQVASVSDDDDQSYPTR